MVGIGVLMLLVSWWGAWILWRGRSGRADRTDYPRRLLYALAAMTFSGWVSTLAGWFVTEIGRQPFMVYGLLRTADLVAEHPPAMVASTLIAYLVVYAFLLAAYVLVLMHMASHPAQPVSGTAQSPKEMPVGGPA
jgi:cytochrome d ubiquinol oxidase subunit I